MLRIGLTGGIGSGKSTVAKVCEILGIPAYYADTAAKKLMNTDPELRNAIIHEFGRDAYTGTELNRKKIASIVFSDPVKLEKLNQLIHPATIRDAEEWMKKQISPYAIKEAALLFESGANAGLDKIIGVSAPHQLRIKRVMDRDGVTQEEVISRMKRQWDEERKMNHCDEVIINNEHEFIIPQVLDLHQQFLAIKK
ncbi:MAG: dephospho-CoA kinase [Chitinophagaceae bacterium]|nr:dephospho-CoA kinase [Chitinophagaceae bacterium]